MYDRILVPTDGSTHATRAARHGYWLADAFDATVDVVNVFDVEQAAGSFRAGGVSEAYFEAQDEKRRETVRETAELAADEDRVYTDLLEGHPAERICQYARERGDDLIVMGVRGNTGLKQHPIGDVTERVLRNAPVPVLTTEASDGEGPVDGYSDVLAPTDGSDAAAVALDHAVEVAAATAARLHGVAVVEDAAAPPAQATPGDSVSADRIERARESVLETVTAHAAAADVPVTCTVLEGSVEERLREYASEEAVDVVVMGTHGHTDLQRELVGSTTEQLIRHSRRPVLAVPEGE